MGEVADLALNGTLCSQCGVYIGKQENDYPSLCEDCEEERGVSNEH